MTVTLAINPGFTPPNVIDETRGVDPDADERSAACRAVAARTMAALMPERMRLWIFRQEQRRGGAGGLTDALIAMRPIPADRDPTAYRKALLRAIERAGPARKPRSPGRKPREQHQTIRSADYRERIGLLLLAESRVVAAVRGRWAYVTETSREVHESWHYTDRVEAEEVQTVRDLLAAGGALPGTLESEKGSYGSFDFIGYTWMMNDLKTVGSAVLVLEQLHGLQIQLDMGRANR